MIRKHLFRCVGWLCLALCGACTTATGMVLETRDTDRGPVTETDDDSPTETDSDGPADSATATDTSRSVTVPLGLSVSGIVDWTTAFPLIDLMKQSRNWYDWDNGSSDGFDIDENGWIRSLSRGQTAGTVFLGSVSDELPVVHDKMVVLYDGEGTIAYDWMAEKIESESTVGRDVIRIQSGEHLLKIVSTNPDNYLRNIAIVPEAMEEDFESGDVFNPVWLDRLHDFGAIRFTEWLNVTESTQQFWSDAPRVSHRHWTDGNIPWEIVIRLANRLTTAPWITVPHLATDDYVRNLAALIRYQLDDDLLVRVEHSHQPWLSENAASTYADTQGRTRWGDFDDAYLQWHSVRTARICDIFKTEVFSDRPQRVQCVLSLPNNMPVAEDAMLTCPHWTTETGTAPCYQHGIDAIAISAFVGGCLGDESQMDTIKSWFADSDGGIARGMEQLSDGRHLAPCGDDIASMTTLFDHFSQLAARYGLLLMAYEGGQHITSAQTSYQDDPDVIAYHIALNRHPDIKERYSELFDAWRAANGQTFIHYQGIQFPSKWGSWGALEYLTQNTSPKWEALLAHRDGAF